MKMPENSKVYAGLLFFAGAAQFLTIMMIGEAMAPGYSMYSNAISDLGVISASQSLFNPSLFITGLLIGLGGYLFHQTHKKAWLTTLFILASIGAMGAAIFNLNYSAHGIFALFAFLFINLFVLAGFTLTRGPLRYVALILGTIGIIAVGLMVLGDSGITAAFGAIGHGGTERLIVYPGLMWLIAFGGYLMTPQALASEK